MLLHMMFYTFYFFPCYSDRTHILEILLCDVLKRGLRDAIDLRNNYRMMLSLENQKKNWLA